MRFGFGRSPVDLVRTYIDAVNRHDLAVVAELMAENMRVTDSAGNECSGRGECIEFIRGIIEMVPDYKVVISSYTASGDDVLMRGRIECSDPRLAVSTHFRACTDGKRITEWQSFGAKPGSVIGYVQNRNGNST